MSNMWRAEISRPLFDEENDAKWFKDLLQALLGGVQVDVSYCWRPRDRQIAEDEPNDNVTASQTHFATLLAKQIFPRSATDTNARLRLDLAFENPEDAGRRSAQSLLVPDERNSPSRYPVPDILELDAPRGWTLSLSSLWRWHVLPAALFTTSRQKSISPCA